MVEVRIEKPLYGNFCYIRDVYINKAERSKDMLKVITPYGERVCSPKEWKDTGKKMEKRFKFPQPMILWGNYVTPYDTQIEGQQSLL